MSATFLSDLKNSAITTPSVQPQLITSSTVNGTGVDMQLTDGPDHAIISVGAVNGTYTTLQAQVTESDDNSTFVAMTEAPATVNVMSANTVYVLSFWKRKKRYLRVEFPSPTGGTNAQVAGLLISRKKIGGTGGGAYTTTP
jgi:hypothetical protein